MRAASTLTAIGAALWFAATSAHALGFGRVSNATQLGQPLNFAAELRLEADESLPRECVSAEVLSGDNKLPPGQVRVTLEGASDSPDRRVRISTSALIDEPVVTVSVTLGCPAKVTRKFVAFIDPPLINAAQTAPVETLPPERVDTQVAPVVTMMQGANAAPAAAKRPDRAASSRPRVRARVATRANEPGAAAVQAPASQTSSPRRAASASRQATIPRAAPAGARLQLEAAPSIAARIASAPGASPVLAAAEPASAPKPDDAAEQLAKERQRIRVLEEGLANLRGDSQATRNSLASLQARLKDAESERYANPLVYALAWLSALLALAMAGLWWRQSHSRRSAQWWAAPAPAGARAAPVAVADAEAQPFEDARHAADAFEEAAVVDEDESSAAPITRPAPFSVTLPGPVAPQRSRELSVEELIDLEQQVEFFIVLGQDEAAVELLMSHVRSDGGISPLPYLKLLEIYRRRGNDDDYERIRERFNRRFNAYAPDWNSDLKHGRALIDYPDTMASLQGFWASPVRVMQTLDALLFRRNKSAETFDLPAYRELLFLYSIARDLAEHGGPLPSDAIDLLLPLEDDAGEKPLSRPAAVFQADSVDVDLNAAPARPPKFGPSGMR